MPTAVAGIALVVLGAVVMTEGTTWVRLSMIGAGLLAAYIGIDRVAKAVFGATFDTGLWMAAGWLALITLSAAFADLLPLSEHEDVSKTLTVTPMLTPDLLSSHPLGTDSQGLDVLGGVIYGARVSLVVGVGATVLGMVLGAAIGLVAGYLRGIVDAAVGLVGDAMLAFPPLILLLAMVAVLEPSIFNTTIALAILTVPTYIRLTRANTLLFAQREFVLAAKALGAKNRRIIVRELLPNVVLPVVSYGVIVVGALVVAEASLSFLGVGVQRPTPTWGNMIAAAQSRFESDPHLVFIPGACLFLTVYALNRVGESARAVWDPRQREL
ncbi:ABC transporter permease [Streptomyces blattellae]|uniref:ABC transporter permease n=1 Tax=Streptomyces blattellae TaxID=2569855 RepID=UPI001E442787|nr:ABC transporter permease [Streptomyces blattellae]